jgi:hypothetical protein
MDRRLAAVAAASPDTTIHRFAQRADCDDDEIEHATDPSQEPRATVIE